MDDKNNISKMAQSLSLVLMQVDEDIKKTTYKKLVFQTHWYGLTGDSPLRPKFCPLFCFGQSVNDHCSFSASSVDTEQTIVLLILV